VSLSCQQTPEIVRAAARFHCHDAGRQFGGECVNRLASHPPAQHHAPVLVHTYQAADILAQVDTQDDYSHGSLLLSSSTSILPMLKKGRAIP
jgi:hypothetical protein